MNTSPDYVPIHLRKYKKGRDLYNVLMDCSTCYRFLTKRKIDLNKLCPKCLDGITVHETEGSIKPMDTRED